jgi:hypothetical protein
MNDVKTLSHIAALAGVPEALRGRPLPHHAVARARLRLALAILRAGDPNTAASAFALLPPYWRRRLLAEIERRGL